MRRAHPFRRDRRSLGLVLAACCVLSLAAPARAGAARAVLLVADRLERADLWESTGPNLARLRAESAAGLVCTRFLLSGLPESATVALGAGSWVQYEGSERWRGGGSPEDAAAFRVDTGSTLPPGALYCRERERLSLYSNAEARPGACLGVRVEGETLALTAVERARRQRRAGVHPKGGRVLGASPAAPALGALVLNPGAGAEGNRGALGKAAEQEPGADQAGGRFGAQARQVRPGGLPQVGPLQPVGHKQHGPGRAGPGRRGEGQDAARRQDESEGPPIPAEGVSTPHGRPIIAHALRRGKPGVWAVSEGPGIGNTRLVSGAAQWPGIGNTRLVSGAAPLSVLADAGIPRPRGRLAVRPARRVSPMPGR